MPSKYQFGVAIFALLILSGTAGAVGLTAWDGFALGNFSGSVDNIQHTSDSEADEVKSNDADRGEETNNAGVNQQNVTKIAVRFDNQSSNGSVVKIASATLPDGGVVVVQADDNGAPGGFLGRSKPLGPGTTEQVTVPLNTPINGTLTLWVIAESGGTSALDSAVVSSIESPFTMPIPGTGAKNAPTDPDSDGLFEDINGDGTTTFDDAVALAFANTDDLTQEQIDALDFDGDDDLDFDDAVELAFSV